MPPMTRPAGRYETLDLMRGLAAFSVLLLHCSPPGFYLAPHGHLAVDLFFGLSGFVVAAAYVPRLATGMRLSAFAAVRMKRLYPLILLGALIGLAGYSRAYPPRDLAVLFVTGLLMLPTPLGSAEEGYAAVAINPPSWSLFWELLVNVIFARWAWRWSRRVLVAILLVSGVALAAQALHYGQLSQGFTWGSWWGGAVRVSFSFTLGVWLHRIERPRWRLPVPLIALVTVGIFLMPALGAWNGLFDMLCVALVFPLLLIVGINSHAPRWTRVSPLLGEASYPAYILQGGVYPHIKGLWHHLPVEGAAMIAATVGIALVFFFGALLVARPYERLVRALLPGVRRVAMPAQAAP
ncbi:acyltransferase family protein [Sphingomonas kyungheensis]|uniref:Acyltransferase n=1 Tax=Sphingomonas kyungheensis TaxID=1069987 RepID=A0ABU8H465_9SPHN